MTLAPGRCCRRGRSRRPILQPEPSRFARMIHPSKPRSSPGGTAGLSRRSSADATQEEHLDHDDNSNVHSKELREEVLKVRGQCHGWIGDHVVVRVSGPVRFQHRKNSYPVKLACNIRMCKKSSGLRAVKIFRTSLTLTLLRSSTSGLCFLSTSQCLIILSRPSSRKSLPPLSLPHFLALILLQY